MKKVYVFIGPVGCGKTTLIDRLLLDYPDFLFYDLFDYVKKYQDDKGFVNVANTINARHELYEDIKLLDKDIVVEFGTNHPELSIEILGKLKNKFEVILFFCTLSKKECMQRAILRAKKDKSRSIPKAVLLEKLTGNFPKKYIEAAEKVRIPYTILPMGHPIEHRLIIIKSMIS